MTTWLRVCMLGLVLLLASAPATRSATPPLDETLTLMLGSGSTLTLERPFETILIDNPDVVGIRALSDQSVLIEPLNLGASNLVFVDEWNIAIASIRVVVRDGRTDHPHSVHRI
jgi:Flp pilus assembly secretin CpaC